MDPYKITFTSWDKVAQAYQDKFMDLDLYNDTYDLFCRLLEKPAAKIFEIGCGPGNMTKYLLARRPDFDIEAIDTSPNMVHLAEKNNPTARFSIMDARHIDQLNTKFDAIICGFCLPYLSKSDAAKLIEDCAGLLNPGGILYFSAIEGPYERSGYEAGSSGDKTYVYYHPTNNLQEQLDKNGFALQNLIRKSYQKSGGEESIHAIFIARKNT
jgi:2-polyprenyl-3-methyl-5-hydroxy-6-metoxy-1,4-benzoquinol methylase